MKKVLIVASVVSFIEWFNKENIDYLHDILKCEVHIACNFRYMEDTDCERTKKYIKKIYTEGIILHNIEFVRSPLHSKNIMAYRKLKKIIESYRFDLIHCHTPTVSIMTRMAARKTRKNGTIVMYTCHGFHFHKSASKKNWVFYYPIEKVMSRFCDYIITINQEDYKMANTFHSPYVRYIPGVGVDIHRISDISVDKTSYKKDIGLSPDCIMILSIGELIERKNHEVIIRALAKVNDKNIHYVICGKGILKSRLEKVAKEVGVDQNVHFLGFRNDISELCNVADICAFPSKIEGLGLAGIEAMAAGIPLISSNVHGILDYVKNGITGYTYAPDDVQGFAEGIKKLAVNENLRKKMGIECKKVVEPFEIENALNAMWNIYKEVLGEVRL